MPHDGHMKHKSPLYNTSTSPVHRCMRPTDREMQDHIMPCMMHVDTPLCGKDSTYVCKLLRFLSRWAPLWCPNARHASNQGKFAKTCDASGDSNWHNAASTTQSNGQKWLHVGLIGSSAHRVTRHLPSNTCRPKKAASPRQPTATPPPLPTQEGSKP